MLFTLLTFLTHSLGINIYKNTFNLLLGLFMATLIWDGSIYSDTSTGLWYGVSVPRTEQTDFTFSNNRITSYNSQGYMLQAGDETPSIYNYNLDGEKITGNYFNWLGDESSTSIITHGLFAGCTRNAVVKYNYLNHVPMAIIRKDASNAVDASGGVCYNIVNGGKVAVNIKGLSGVRVYNNTFYCDKTTSQTWRPLVFIYTNTDITPNSKAEGTKIYNNIFYTKYQTSCITLSDSSCLSGFESDYNVFWNESNDGSIRFGYLGSTLTFEQWQALGYDQHSVVMDPSFIDFVNFVPTQRLDYGTNLGVDYSTGLATDASWNVGVALNTTIQNGTWQVGAVLYEAKTPAADPSVYYVSNAGNDASTGTSPSTAWRTIDKVNASLGNIDAGDSIVFRRGDTFYGTLNITKSGVDGSAIVFGAYGTGNDPIITGFTTITSGWTSIGNGIYSRDISADQQTNMVLIDGTQYAMGRWPKGTTYNTFESHDGSLSITDNTLSSTPDWTGADVVIRQNWWTQTRFKILNHDGSTIVYNDGSNPDADAYMQDGFGYFIQNDLSTLYIDPSYGEWYHDTSAQKIYMYFGSEDPSTKIVQVATKGNLVSNATSDYLTFNNLSFIGCTSTALSFTPYVCTNITITDCSIQYAGLDGISELGEDASVYRNTVQNCNQGGIVFTGDNGRVTYNTIKNIGLIPGQAYKNGFSTAIRIGSTNAVVHNNYIQNIGYNGISGGTGTSASVKYNYIDNVCRTINDGGGIYHGQSNSVTPPGQWIIEYNIILNTYGNTNGTSTPNTYLGEGIYLDSWCRDASVRYNICANNRGTGIKIGSGRYNTIEDNLCFNNYEAQLYVLGSWAYPTIIDNTILRNQFIAKEATQLTLKVGLSASDNISNYGTSNYNIYARPIDDVSNSIYTTQTGGATNYRNLSSWRTFSGEDANSRTSFTNVSSTNEILFYYNETNTNKVVATLTTPMVDVSGNSYSIGNLILTPYTGIVLLPNPSANVYYLSADGSDNNAGTIDSPWFTLEKAWDYVSPGDIVYMRGGTYYYPKTQWLTGASGTPDNYISILNYPGEVPLIRPAVGWTYDGWYYGILFQSMDYIHVKGLDIGYFAYQQTSVCRGIMAQHVNNSIFENLSCHHNELGMSLIGNSGNNLILNCDFYENYDPYTTIPYNNGDGLTVSEIPSSYTNTIRGCRSWWNADDGYDFWGNEGIVYVENCWAWMNGYQEDHVSHNEAPMIGNDGNGFKLGQVDETTTTTRRYLYNCVGALNRINNFSHNVVDPQVLTCEIYNCFSFGVAEYSGFQFNWGAEASINSILRNNIAYLNTANLDSWITHDHNSWNSGYDVSANDFISLDASELFSSRDTSGNLPRINFGRLATGSDLIHTGIAISGLTEDGNGDAWNDPPSLGAFEYSAESSTSLPYLSTTTITDISTNSATGGGNVTHDGSSNVFAKGICWNTSINPTVLNSSTNDGTGEGSYISYLTNLNPSTHYFVRAYAINDVGVGYGDNIEFDTLATSQEQPADSSVSLKTYLVNPFIQSRYYVSLGGKFYTMPYTEPPAPEPSVYLYKRTGTGWDEDGAWAYDEFCASFEMGCDYDVSFGIITDNPVGHFTVLSELPSWLRLYDSFTEEDLSIGSHISDVSGRVFKAHPMTENNTGQDRDGSVYITNDFGQSVTFYVIQYKQPVAPTLTLAIDPCDYSNLDLSTYDSATVSAGSANAVVSGLYLVPWPYDYIGDMDVSWRAVRTDIEPNEDYGSGSLPTYNIDDSINETLVMSQSANSSQEFYVYFKQTPELNRTPTSKSFTKVGGDVSINITTNPSNPWAASDSCTWITLTNESSIGSGQFIITVAQQEDGGRGRSGRVFITSQDPCVKEVYITQEASLVLTTSPDYYLFGQAGGTYDISVLTHISNSWEASTSASWLSFSGSPTGTGNGNLTLWANSQPESGAGFRETFVYVYSDASTAAVDVDQEYLNLDDNEFSWTYSQTSEQTSTVTTSYSAATPHWIITNAASIPAWLTWGVYNVDVLIDVSANYESGYTIKAYPSQNTGYTSRTASFDISTGSGMSSQTITVYQGPAPEPATVNLEPSGFIIEGTTSASATVGQPYLSFSVLDFDGWNILYGSYSNCYYMVKDASDNELIAETLLTDLAIDDDTNPYSVSNANLGRNVVSGDVLSVILYGVPV